MEFLYFDQIEEAYVLVKHSLCHHPKHVLRATASRKQQPCYGNS